MQRSSGPRVLFSSQHPRTSFHTHHTLRCMIYSYLCRKNTINVKRNRANLRALPCPRTDALIYFQIQGCTVRQSAVKRSVISVLYEESRSPAFDLRPLCPFWSTDVSFTLPRQLILSEVGLKLSDNRCQYAVCKHAGTFACTPAQSQLGLKGCAC